MELARIFDACQADRFGDWRQMPVSDFNDPGTSLLAGLCDPGGGEPLRALYHLYHAVYVPNVRLQLAWGMRTQHTERWEGQRPDWADDDWGDPVEPCLAHVLFNGTAVWEVTYTYINRGAGRDGILPWPRPQFEQGPTPLGATPGGWNTTRWEVEFVRLLCDLQGIDDWDIDRALRGWGLRIHERSPLEP